MVSLLKNLLQKSKQSISLKLDNGRLDYCLFEPSISAPTISAAGVEELSQEALETEFKRIINQVDGKGRDAHWVLPTSSYRLLTIEKPAVPDEELSQAIQWQVKDLIDTSLEQAVITSFDYPESLAGPKRLFVVVARRDEVMQIIELSKESGLELKTIGIEELSLGHLLSEQLSDGQNLAFIAESSSGLTINCFLGHEFVFTRSLPNVYLPDDDPELFLDLDDAQPNAATDSDDQWLLEVQRTLDYYESQIAKRSVTKVVVPQLGKSTETIVSSLESNLGLKVEVFTFADLCLLSDGLSEQKLSKHLTVCGGCLGNTERPNATS